MTRLSLYAVLAAALLATHGGAWLKGRSTGVEVTEARHTAAVAELRAQRDRHAREAVLREADRLAAIRERDALANELERLAHEDPDADRIAIGADSVQRLNRR